MFSDLKTKEIQVRGERLIPWWVGKASLASSPFPRLFSRLLPAHIAKACHTPLVSSVTDPGGDLIRVSGADGE